MISLLSAQILNPNSCCTRQVVGRGVSTGKWLGEGEEIGIVCDPKETFWTLASTKRRELIDLE